MKHNFFDSIIKDKANNHQAPVPADAWSNINKKRKKKRGIVWWLFATVLIASSVVGVYKFGYEHHLTIANTNDVDKENETSSSKKLSAEKIGNENNDTNNVAKNAFKKDILANDTAYQTTNSTESTKETVERIDADTKREENKSSLLETAADKKIKTSLNRKGKFSIHIKAAKASSDESAIAATTNLKKEKKKVDKIENVTAWDASKKNKSFKPHTAIKTATPTLSEENNNIDTAIIKDELPSATIEKIAGDNRDSLNTVASNILHDAKNKVSDTVTKPISVKIKYKPKNIFVDISTMPFLPIQKNASLVNIKRTIVGNLSRSEYTADDIRTSMDPSFSYTIALRKKIAAKWYAGIGVQYVLLKENISLSGKEINTQYNVIKRLDNTGSFLVDDTVATVTKGTRIINAVNSYQLISLPVFAQYQILQNKAWQLSVNGGLNFTVKKTYQNSIAGTLVADYTSAALANKKEHAISTDIFASLRLARGLGKNYSIYAEPTLQFNLTQYNMANMIDYKYIHKAGLSIGIAYKLNY